MPDHLSNAHRILHEGHPSTRTRTQGAIVFKQANVFMISAPDGNVLPGSEQGLFFHDTRYLSEHVLEINGARLVSLLAAPRDVGGCVLQLTNPDLYSEDGTLVATKESLGIRCDRQIGEQFTETVTVENYRSDPLNLTLTLTYKADFSDMFEVRGADQQERGTLRRPRWSGDGLTLRYDGADGHRRQATVHFTPAPDRHRAHTVAFTIALAPRGRWTMTAVLELLDVNDRGLEITPAVIDASVKESVGHARRGALGTGTRIETDQRVFNAVLTQSLLDLHMLRMRQHGRRFFAAGIPWYVALFGRDSLVTALQVAAFEPDIVGQTLRVLAAYQGTKIDDWRDEQPGKILHELRVGEMANLNEIPQTPYYGSVDSTLKFLILLGIYCDWCGSLDLFHELRPNVDAALSWIDDFGDSDGDGYIDYIRRSKHGLRNQGWKDSGNAVVMDDGSLAEPPIALPEVQGETYLAWKTMARLFDLAGECQTASRLDDRARTLHESFNNDFWRSEIMYCAFCKQGDGRFSTSVTSNPAHAIWTGIFNNTAASAIVGRIMQPDMFSGWGVRTLSSNDRSYNPVDYQVGSIWPHDNAFIVDGLYRTGHTDEAHTIFTALLDAAGSFMDRRLPETFAGYDRDYAPGPIRYPVACSPQAWAAGAVPLMLQSALGLRPDGLSRRLVVMQPALPEWLSWVNMRGIRIAGGTVDLRYERSGSDTFVTVTRKDGQIDVDITY